MTLIDHDRAFGCFPGVAIAGSVTCYGIVPPQDHNTTVLSGLVQNRGSTNMLTRALPRPL